ncbi:MAG: hypothetical protein RLZZ276_2609 [Pseudomonadota bacterium]|jgi:carbon-monoxide dehydrogenase large subunit
MTTTGRRIEDQRLLSGKGAFAADRVPPGAGHVAFVRAVHAHAILGGVVLDAVRSMPGVVGVFTAADLAADGVGALGQQVGLVLPGGAPAPLTPRPVLADGRVRHLGEPVAMVVARTQSEALDAAELVEVACTPLPAAADVDEARRPGAEVLWPMAPGNLAFLWSHGAREEVSRVLGGAHRVTRVTQRLSRVHASPMEPRVTIAIPEGDRLVVRAATQTPYGLRDGLAAALRLPRQAIRVVAGDVGGAFGLKADLCREDVATCWAARRLGRPLCWISGRAEAFLGDDHARDVAMDVALALDEAGNFLALDVSYQVNVGAYLSGRSLGPITNIGGIAGVYRIPAIHAEVAGVFTNTNPTAPYRGAGRPDATFALERVIDMAAAEMGIDPFALRRRNLVPASAMPYDTGFLFRYDCGDFEANMEAAARLADIAGFPARRAEAACRGRLRGLGICNPIEVAGGPWGKVLSDAARIEIGADGNVRVVTGAMSVGQGLETGWSRMVAARLGIPVERVSYLQGDTDALPSGRGSGGSAGLCVSGTAVSGAVDAAIEAGRAIAADRLEASSADIEYADGLFRVIGTDRCVGLQEVAALAGGQAAPDGGAGGLRGDFLFQPPTVTFPNGCHVCEVEVDPETGVAETIAYSIVEDVGRVLDPVLVHGQIHGGVAQGLGQALMESVAFDPRSAQLVTGSFMDYAMPRAADMPEMRIETRDVPTAVNALGAKGVGEAGTVGSLTAVINAICDALAPLGVRQVEMPLTPARIWSAINAASRRPG